MQINTELCFANQVILFQHWKVVKTKICLVFKICECGNPEASRGHRALVVR